VLLQVWAFEEEEEEEEEELYVRSEPRKRVQTRALPTETGQGNPSSLSSFNMRCDPLVGLGRTELDRHVHLRGCDECLRSFAWKNKCTHVNLPGACLHEQHSMNRMIADEMQEIATRFTELQPVSRRSEDSAMTELSSPESVAQIFPAHVFYLG